MQTLKFDVNGMTCGGCTGSVQRALTKIDGVSRVNVSLQPGIATVEADTARVTPDQIEAVISDLGYQAKLRPFDATQGAKS
jgi:copper chaperone